MNTNTQGTEQNKIALKSRRSFSQYVRCLSALKCAKKKRETLHTSAILVVCRKAGRHRHMWTLYVHRLELMKGWIGAVGAVDKQRNQHTTQSAVYLCNASIFNSDGRCECVVNVFDAHNNRSTWINSIVRCSLCMDDSIRYGIIWCVFNKLSIRLHFIMNTTCFIISYHTLTQTPTLLTSHHSVHLVRVWIFFISFHFVSFDLSLFLFVLSSV